MKSLAKNCTRFMATPLKELYSEEFYREFASILVRVLPGFSQDSFTQSIFDAEWDHRELKDRMKHTALVLKDFLPPDYPAATAAIINCIELLEAEGITNKSLEYMFFPAYVENFGLEDFTTSVKAMERITQFTSCEFAVRPFYLGYREAMLEQTMHWAKHSDFRVRRLASEGCRPRLPWAVAIPYLKKRPGSDTPGSGFTEGRSRRMGAPKCGQQPERHLKRSSPKSHLPGQSLEGAVGHARLGRKTRLPYPAQTGKPRIDEPFWFWRHQRHRH